MHCREVIQYRNAHAAGRAEGHAHNDGNDGLVLRLALANGDFSEHAVYAGYCAGREEN